MDVIWKFSIKCDAPSRSGQHVITVEMPTKAKTLCVMNQNDNICLWAQVNPKAALVKRRFYCIGTSSGDVPTGSGIVYIGSVIQSQGVYVWHLYEHLEGF